MAITPQDVEANASDLLRELRRGIDYSETPGGRMSGLDIISRLALDPTLTLADVLPPDRPDPQTTLGGEPPPPPADRPFPPMQTLPRLPGQVPVGQGLRPQSEGEFQELRQDERSGIFGPIAEYLPAVGAGQGIGTVGAAAIPAAGRAIAAGGRVLANNPRATIAAGALGVSTAPFAAERAGRQDATATAGQSAADRLIAEQQRLTEQLTEIRNETRQFAELNTGSRDAVRRAQQRLNVLGYNVETDGGFGPLTRAAMARFQQDRSREMEQLNGQITALNGQITTAQNQERSDAENRRMREAEERVSGPQKMLRQWGPWAGYVPGAIMAFLTRRAMTGSANEASRQAAARSNALVAGQGDRESRIAGVNTFWQEGGAGTVPFSPAPAARFGVRSNSDAPSATTLYPPPGRLSNTLRGRDLAILAGAGTEATAFHILAENSRAEQADAQRAVDRNPTEANISRLQRAIDMAAIYDTASNLGRGMGLIYASISPKMAYRTTRPDVNLAEAERIRLDRAINLRRGSGPASPAPAAPTGTPTVAPGTPAPEGSIWNARAGRWQGPAEPGRPGRPFLHSNYAPPARRNWRDYPDD